MLVGDPPASRLTRAVWHVCRPEKMRYLALYDMNRGTDARRAVFPRPGGPRDGELLMRGLVIYCHPAYGSFTEAVRDTILATGRRGRRGRLRPDLYVEGFRRCVRPRDEGTRWSRATRTRWKAMSRPRLCDTLIFVPTWCYALPAMIQGWLDRVMLPCRLLLRDARRRYPRSDAYHPGWACSRPAGQLVG